MKANSIMHKFLFHAGLAMGAVLFCATQPVNVSAQNMADYTNYPVFLNQTVPPNVLFLVDMGNATIEAAYSGLNHKYPLSFKTGTATASQYASNVTFDSAAGADLVAVDSSGSSIAAATTAAPADVFNSAKSYYGIFDPLRCYVTDSNSFNYGAVKASVSAPCANTMWDGNFLNWLAMRKKEMIYQVLIGGRSYPASANTDGTANALAGERTTGENGTTNTCNSSAKPCWRYVKFVPSATLTGRAPSALPVVTVPINGGGTESGGIFFGFGEGKLYVNDASTSGGQITADPFDTAPGNQYSLEVDLTTEPNTPAGTGNINDNCILGDPNYAGHLICYKRQWSWGLFQKMRLDNMHVGVMFVNASTGQGASAQFLFDEAFNASDITNIRNEHIEAHSPLAEALYEGLCLFRKSQGPCYSNSGSWTTGYDTTVGAQGDPFYFVSSSQMVRCCKNFVLMISPGIGEADGNAPDLQQPFGNLFSGSNLGVITSGAAGDRLDDVAYYGRTHDLRSDLGGNQFVTFYSVNAMGGPAGATLLASAAKYGGFQDRNNDNAVDLTGSQTCTYPAGSNLGSGSSTSNAEWDLDQNCVPDTFFDASEGGDLEAQITKAINEILKRAASGTSISVLASSSTGEGSFFQAFFYPSSYEGLNEIKWTGYVQGLFIDPFGNLREDRGGAGGAGDAKLVYTDDNIIQFRLDTTTGDVLVDRYADSNGDGKADSTSPYETVALRETQGLWEAGRSLALRDLSASPRNIITWVDTDNDGVVDSGEQIAFSSANAATLSPYLRADASGTYTANNIIDFVHGVQVTGMRNRQLTVGTSLKVWRLGDVVNSTPTIVGPPRERFDILYGDTGYQKFLLRWKDRRQVAYVGANDGMLHAFNVGHYHRGDDPNTSGVTEHGWYTRNPSNNSSGPALGEELWGFIPYHLLPQLRWLTQPDYTHVSYVDLKPKVTDVRIFTPEAACGGGTTPTASGCIHPDGWGTILIGGMRFGGSCGACTGKTASGGKGGPGLHLIADFNGNGTTTDAVDDRYFYSAYFVLDITNPDATPTLLGVYSASDLGLTTSYPTVVRMNPTSDGKTVHTNAKWFMVFGSGPHGYDGSASAASKLFAVALGTPLGTTPTVTKLPAGTANAFFADPITLDRDLDFRSDAVYVGRTFSSGSSWFGNLRRLTMGTCSAPPCSTSTWGIASGPDRISTQMIYSYVDGAGVERSMGPVTASPSVTMDDVGNVWVFIGTGRFFNAADKADTSIQQLYGAKDSVLQPSGGCTQTAVDNCHEGGKDGAGQARLVNVSAAQICVSCSAGSDQVSGMAGTTTFSALIALVQSKRGWVSTLQTAGERSVVNSTVISGVVFFPTFIPSTDICVAAGNSNLYGLFYLTGSAYTEPIFGVDGSGHSVKSLNLGEGLASQVAIQLGSQPTGMSGFYQSTNALTGKVTPKAPLSAWSQYVSWISRRD